MKILLFLLFPIVAHSFFTESDTTHSSFSSDDSLRKRDRPLEGIRTFAVILVPELFSQADRKKIKKIAVAELSVLGKVHKHEDARGLTSSNFLVLRVNELAMRTTGTLLTSRATVHVERLKMSRRNRRVNIWTVPETVQFPSNSRFGDGSAAAFQKLLHRFVRHYQFANRHEIVKPTFFLYF
jgi:hypothetical protein